MPCTRLCQQWLSCASYPATLRHPQPHRCHHDASQESRGEGKNHGVCSLLEVLLWHADRVLTRANTVLHLGDRGATPQGRRFRESPERNADSANIANVTEFGGVAITYCSSRQGG